MARQKKQITNNVDNSINNNASNDNNIFVPEQKVVKPRKERHKRQKRTSMKNLYFHSGTQAAIVAYQDCIDPVEKNKLYLEQILPAFEKLCENLINVYKFAKNGDTYEDLKHDCINFLFETIKKFKSAKGTNAFSYFNVVAKNWLIAKAQQKITLNQRYVSLDSLNELSTEDKDIIDDFNFVPSIECDLQKTKTIAEIDVILQTLRNLAETPAEIACLDAIQIIFKLRNELDLLNRQAIILYMKEISGLSSREMSTAMAFLRKAFKYLKIQPESESYDNNYIEEYDCEYCEKDDCVGCPAKANSIIEKEDTKCKKVIRLTILKSKNLMRGASKKK